MKENMKANIKTDFERKMSTRFCRDLKDLSGQKWTMPKIREIINSVPDIEYEVFVHGAQCVSFSGRCLISDYMTKGERKANHGNCSQSCRWSYKLVEETREGEYFDIEKRHSNIKIEISWILLSLKEERFFKKR